MNQDADDPVTLEWLDLRQGTIRFAEGAGYACTRAAVSLGVFDVIGIGPTDVVLVQVKTRDWPGEIEMEDLRQFRRPVDCRELVHRWRDRRQLPDMKEIQQAGGGVGDEV
jgi:hypothetical protein